MGLGTIDKEIIDKITEMAPKYGLLPTEHNRWDYFWSSNPKNFGNIGNNDYWAGISLEDNNINITMRVRNKNMGGPYIGFKRSHLEHGRLPSEDK